MFLLQSTLGRETVVFGKVYLGRKASAAVDCLSTAARPYFSHWDPVWSRFLAENFLFTSMNFEPSLFFHLEL